MIFNPITCHGQSWGNYCLVCEDEMEKWILFDEVQVMRDCDEIDHNKIEIVEA